MTEEELAERAIEAGRADLAALILIQALPTQNPPNQQNIVPYAITLMQQARWTEALPLMLQAVRLQPQNSELYDYLGVVYAQLKRLAEAEIYFMLAVRINPKFRGAYRNWIQSLFDQKKFSKAAEVIQQSMQQFPADDELALQLAAAFSELKQFTNAENVLLALPEAAKQSAHYWNRLGVVRGSSGRVEEAIECFLKQIELQPNQSLGYANLAAAYGKAQRWQDAIQAGKRAVELDPRNAGAWSNLGNAYRDYGALELAEAALREACRLDPNASEGPGNLALTLAMNGRTEEAISWYNEALRRKPDNAEIRFNRAVALLSLGNYEAGWPEYEWRWNTEQMRGQAEARRLPKPPWRGEPLAGKTLLIHSEQGHGDTFQFIKLIQLLDNQTKAIYVIAALPTATMLRTMHGVTEVLLQGQTLPEFDYHIPLMSLPYMLKLRVDTIPRNTPYLTAPNDKIEHWKQECANLPGRKIGLVWQGNPKHVGDRWRSLKLSELNRLSQVNNISWISLQKGFGSNQIAESELPNIYNFGAKLDDDFADAAGLLMNLDLLITVDTAMAHLAGSLGRHVILLLPKNSDWRWLKNRKDTPWYPEMMLIRQSRFGVWDEPIQECLQVISSINAS